MAHPHYRLGIDIGGTFTDLSLLDETSGSRIEFKTPTVPDSPAEGVANGLSELIERGVEPNNIGYFVHGTTMALNALIQRRGARLGLLVTEGFRDVLEQARLRIPIPYDFYSHRTRPLVPRENVLPVRERNSAEATILPLTEDECRRVKDALIPRNLDAVVIAFLHSYARPEHERFLAKYLREKIPGLRVFTSAEIWPQMREYERTMVAVMNAFVQPSLWSYLSDLQRVLSEAGVPVRPYIARSNGGIMTVEAAKTRPIDTLLSGPASGVTGALEASAQSGLQNLVTLDIGGTSADVSIVVDGSPEQSREEEVEDLPMIVPTIGVSAIGAGGGSVAWLDSVGVLRVGPESAGAYPGPASYGLGGSRPTLSDAFVQAGYLNPETFAGRDNLDTRAAHDALRTVSEPLELDAGQVAEAVIQLAVANMFTELSAVIERRGIDPREFTLVAFGGAGPVIGALLADEMRFPRVLVPQTPGTLCARGALGAPIMSDFVRSAPWRLDEPPPSGLRDVLADLEAAAHEWITSQAPDSDGHSLDWSASCRYVGQAHEIDVPIERGWLSNKSAQHIEPAFHHRHELLFAHADKHAAVEIIEVRVRARGETPSAPASAAAPNADGAPVPFTSRSVLVAGGWYEAGCYQRADLHPADQLSGPAIVEQPDTTVLIPPGWCAKTDDALNLILSKELA